MMILDSGLLFWATLYFWSSAATSFEGRYIEWTGVV